MWWVRNHSLALAICPLTVQSSGLSRQCWSLVAQLQAYPWASCVPFLILSLLICKPRIRRVSISWLRQCFWSKSPWESDNQYCSCNHCIITVLFAQMINLMRRGLWLARGTWLIGGRKGLFTKTYWFVLFFFSIPSRVVLNVRRKKKKKSQWVWMGKKSEKRRNLISHITVLLIQTSQIISLHVYICGYIFHWLR